jgi:hypothetical protein
VNRTIDLPGLQSGTETRYATFSECRKYRYLLQIIWDESLPACQFTAWGVHGRHLKRDITVRALISNMQCLGLTKDGHPKHPLYVKADTQLITL